MDTLLRVDPVQRRTTTFALNSEFFTTRPFACDPSSLHKYPPSKEIDAKLQDKEARRYLLQFVIIKFLNRSWCIHDLHRHCKYATCLAYCMLVVNVEWAIALLAQFDCY